MTWPRARRLLLAAAAAVLLSTAVGVGPAGAHSTLVRSDPPDGGLVAVGRTGISLWFDEPVDLASGRFVLRTSAGSPVRVTADVAAGRSTFAELHTSPLRRSILVLSWTVTSAVDGHVSTGSITFGVGIRPDPVTSATSAPSGLEVAVRWLQLAALIAAVGAFVAPVLLRRAAGLVPQAPELALRLGAIAALVGLLTSLATPAGVVGSLQADRWAQLWVVRLVALLVAAVAFAGLARQGPSPGRRWTAGCALVVAVAADAASGHAAGLPRASAAAVVATTVHVLAAGAWIGTLAVLAACLLPTMRRRPELRRPLLESTWRAFGPVAAVSVALVLASGLYLAGRQLPDLGALTSRWYGLALTVKLVLVAVALVTAARTTLLLGRRLPSGIGAPRWLARTTGTTGTTRFDGLVVTELSVLTAAVLSAAVMTTVPTARTTTGEPVPGAGSGVTVDGLYVTFEAVPAGSGETRVVVRVNAVTRPQPGPVTGADVLLVGAGGEELPVRLNRVEPGHFEGAAPSPSSGHWQAWVNVHRRSVTDAVARVDWVSAARTTPPPSRLEVLATVLAGVLGLGALVAALVASLVARRRRPAVPPPSDDRQVLELVGGPRADA